MSRLGTRLAIILFALALQAAAVFKLVETDRRLVDARIHLFTVSDQTERVARLLAELRALQFAHVAGAQAASSEPAAILFDDIERRMVAMRAQAAPEAAQALGVSLDLLRTLREIDSRLRTFVAAGDRVMALDLTQGEAREVTSNLAGQVGQARESEVKMTEARLGALRLIEAYFLIGALGIGLLALLIVYPGGRPVPKPPIGEQPVLTAGADPAGSLGLRHAATAEAAATATFTDMRPTAADARATPSMDLWQTAKLCTDLVKLGNPGELPALLARAAMLIEATGVIVWVVDPVDRSLRPASAHGYPQEAIDRIGAIAADADNATAAACRTGKLQVVRADRSSPGALTVPMSGPSGCVGVMAAEVKPGRETDPGAQAVATILAAQLATLVQPATTTPV